MIGVINALLPVMGILGLGGAGTIACLVGGWLNPRYLYVCAMAAAALAAATVMYAKGVHDDFVLQLARTHAAIVNELKQEEEARKEAEKYVKQNPVTPPGKPVPKHFFRRDADRVRDQFDRDQYSPDKGPTPRRVVPPMAPTHLLSEPGYQGDGGGSQDPQ